ncbi:cupin-like domain containing protein [Nitzschia inconspicua]|uniref:Cupin-like domain containing protein n=1 Tax=Nitzschia inconspicua TaxID=303405 RepID=A0A9K3LN62_9STRA|nr:cupin-like domain containing protein [Nitzschia inconspicua]
MKLNYETCLVGEKVMLVPYRSEHVPKYHEWMQDPSLLEATGSEPLSYQEETQMQQSWRDDPKKCTFIVHRTPLVCDQNSASFDVNDNLQYMVGDVNLFLSEIDNDEDEDEQDVNQNTSTTSIHPQRIQAEVDIMIAEQDYRGKGLGRAASCAMMLYGLEELGIERYFCKINEDNQPSINLFSSLGFQQSNYAACFKQVEMELRIESQDEIRQILIRNGGAFKKVPCPLTTTSSSTNATCSSKNCTDKYTPDLLYRYERSPTRGRCLVAATNIQEGQLIFVERPLVAMQSMGNVFDGALVCTYCMSFCGSPKDAIRIAAEPTCLPEITTNVTTSSSSSNNEHELIPCRHKCGHVYCCLECQEDDWEWGGHSELCTGWIEEESGSTPIHPLLKFKLHARETNEIFLLIATWLVRILKQNVPYEDDDNNHVHPYTDFMMNPWWEVKKQEVLYNAANNPGVFAEAASLEKTLKQLCQESHSHLKQALPGRYECSPWLTPLGMARLIGSLEQNCLGIRRKHAVHRNIMEDAELRQEMHSEIIRCLERAGMIGTGDGEECSSDCSDDHDQDETKDTITDGVSDGEDEQREYSFDDIAHFLANFPAHTNVDMEDDWDEVFRPLDGTAHFTVATKMNHSCQPNVIVLYKTRGWGKDHPLVAYCVALRDIAEGEELTICYIDSNDEVEKRQADLANYGFACSCEKCQSDLSSLELKGKEPETDKRPDEEDLFGSDSEEDPDPGSAQEQQQDSYEPKYEDHSQSGDSALAQMAEQIDSVLNQSRHGKIPISQLAVASTFVVRTAKTVLNDQQVIEETRDMVTSKNLLKQCSDAVQSRDFASCRIVGGDLEQYLFNDLGKNGSFSSAAIRASYWCASVTSAIGYANEGAFLVAMKYLDKGLILGVSRQEISGFFTYVETFASQMAHSPCPPATNCCIPYYQEPHFEALLCATGLSRPIEYTVQDIKTDASNVQEVTTMSFHNDSPFVIRGIASEWPSISKWRDMNALTHEHGHRLVPIEIGCMTGKMTEKIVSFRQFVDSFLSESAKRSCWGLADATSQANAEKIGYLAQHPLLEQIPALNADIDPNPLGIQPTKVNIWWGTGGTRTPLHFDSYDNLLVQLVGAKYVRLYAREDTAKLYVSVNKTYGLQGNMSDIDCEMEDFVKYPLAEDCHFQEVLLLPGDCLFIPSQCWHYVRSLSTSVSINYWF